MKLRKLDELKVPFSRLDLARRICERMKAFVKELDVSASDGLNIVVCSQSDREESYSLDMRAEKSLLKVYASSTSGSCPSGR